MSIRPSPIEIVIRPKGIDRYLALIEGEAVVTSRQPLFASARVLLERGVDPHTVITMRHEGSATVSMRSTVGRAAGWRVEEPDRGGIRLRRHVPREPLTAHGAALAAGESQDGQTKPEDRCAPPPSEVARFAHACRAASQ
ncbi:hypothetical protein [Ancylobacter moscoviensis]